MATKNLERPLDAWLPKSSFNRLRAEYIACWTELEASSPPRVDPRRFQALQNRSMYLKFFLEQAFGSGAPAGRSLRLIERDFGDFQTFRSRFLEVAADESVEWIVWGLSFASFAFHLFPISQDPAGVPFCASPMLCACSRSDICAEAGLTRVELAEQQLLHLDWTVVEGRIACLEEPLDVFDDTPADCAPDHGCGSTPRG